MTQSPLGNSLKLTFCPRCDYSLQGLPDTGICPECGDPYNQDFIVLRGRPITSGDEPNGQKPASVAGIIGRVLSLAVLYCLVLLHFPFVIIVVCFCYCVAGLIRAVLKAASSVRGREVLVWLSPVGIAEQPFVDPESVAGRCLHYYSFVARVCLLPLTVLIICALAPQNDLPLSLGIGVIVAALSFFLLYLIYLGSKPTPSLRPSGIRPALLPWSSFGAIEIEELGGGSFQLWARKLKSTHIRRSDVIKIECQSSVARREQLFQHIRQWADRSVPVTLKPQSPGALRARNAGLALGRIWRCRIARKNPI